MQFWKLILAVGSFAVAVPSLPRRKSGLLIQSVRHSSRDNATAQGRTAQQPSDFFARDFEKMDELPNTYDVPVDNDKSKKISSLLISPAPGPAGPCQPQPVGSVPVADPLSQLGKQPLLSSKGRACESKFKPLKAFAKGCHPKCSWTCEEKNCNTKCQPTCSAPKCVTACEKVKLGECRRKCRDPHCAIVCPPQCAHGKCPECETVCDKHPICDLDCGNRRCESRCADPECTWACTPSDCEKPKCTMKCDQTICTIGKETKLPTEFEAPYLGQEIGWTGLAKVPLDHLNMFAAQPMGSAALWGPAKMMGGAQPLPPGGFDSITSKTGIVMSPDVNPAHVLSPAPPSPVLSYSAPFAPIPSPGPAPAPQVR